MGNMMGAREGLEKEHSITNTTPPASEDIENKEGTQAHRPCS